MPTPRSGEDYKSRAQSVAFDVFEAKCRLLIDPPYSVALSILSRHFGHGDVAMSFRFSFVAHSCVPLYLGLMTPMADPFGMRSWHDAKRSGKSFRPGTVSQK